ncbi:palladin isoform X3 [Alosa sapidissima]|uniref:palladin isoform X3 n=1 Tax=Alosa sapidissima TaxID=34773 RepID=UPI001C09E233|nr:palladin isoform X3 [Alosa sapidissima]
MQDGSCNEPLPHSLLLKDSAALEGHGAMYSDTDLFPDSLAELEGGDCDFPELSAFLSEDEMSLSLDLAREAMSDASDPNDPDPPAPCPIDPVLQALPSVFVPPPQPTPPQPPLYHETRGPFLHEAPISHTLIQTPEFITTTSRSPHGTPLLRQSAPYNPPLPSTNAVGAPPASPEKFVCHKAITPVYKQERPRLVHGGLELNERAASATEFCSRAATFIEELSSIFKGPMRPGEQRRAGGGIGSGGGGGGSVGVSGGGEEDSSSPDSGYLSPQSHRQPVTAAPPSSASSTTSSASSSSLAQQGAHHRSQVSLAPEALAASSGGGGGGVPEAQQQQQQARGGVLASDGLISPPHFTQKLKSQEVAEGSPIRLECRVSGNPQPLVRWFCEGRELHHCPDIQIWRDGDLHTLVIAEAFEDDTGRYTCVASNALGADNTSAEVYIEGASSSDSEGEGSVSKSKQGAMPQVQKKTTSVSLTIRSPSPKSPEVTPHRSTLVQPLSIAPQRVQSPVSSVYGADGLLAAPPVFTKVLQDAQASEGQVVVLECRVRGSPPLKVQWYRLGEEIQDSPDFRILQKKPRSAAEPEEICTLVIAEAFPEDGGLFCCTASNQYGSVNSTANLTITPVVELPSNGVSGGDDSAFEDSQPFPPPPPPPPTEISLLEVPPKTPPSAEGFHVNELEIWPRVSAPPPPPPPLQVPAEADHHAVRANGTFQNGQSSTLPPKENAASVKESPLPPQPVKAPTLPSTPSPAKEGPPLPIKPKPKLNAEQLKQLRDQILLEQQEAAIWQQQVEQEVPPPPLEPQQQQEGPPPSPPLPPPPSFQELEVSAMQTSTFNYARPKQFIAAQSPGGSSSGGGGGGGGPMGGYATQSSNSSGSSLPSPLSPPSSHKPFGRIPLPPYQPPAPGLAKAGSAESPSSPSFPPPPPPFLSSAGSSSVTSPASDFPPPPPPPPPPVSASPTLSDRSSPFTSTPNSPANFLVSVLPATPTSPSVNSMGLPKGNGVIGFSRKPSRTSTRIATDSEIQGSKDSLIQDLERKLRFKEERMNGQRLTYEEKMARRLLGADNAATVLNVQEQEDEPATQESSSSEPESVPQKEYKVSSFEQRLISEIEFRLERSPVEESDDDVQHDEDAPGECVAPFFDSKLKHYKVFEGMPVTFSCKVIGDPKPKIYWFKDGKQISKRSEHYRISRDADGTCNLHTASASLDDDGNYTIMAGNPAGRISCTGRMMVQAVNQRGRSQRSTPGHIRRPRSRSRDSGDENENIQERHFRPHFLQAPGDLIVQEGRLCRMDCKVSGLPTPDLIWQLNGQTIRPDSAHKMLVRENGVHSLVIEPVTSRDAGIYTCIASNRAGQNSFNLELIVAAKEMHKAPTFIEKLQNTGVAEGYPVRLECRVSGVPFPQIFWKRENESLTHNTDRISMHQDNFGYLCMIIQPALKEDAGWYTVSAKNEAGIVSSTARLDIHSQWQQTQTPKLKKVRPSTSRYAALTERGLDVKAAFFPDSSPLPPGGLVESEDL